MLDVSHDLPALDPFNHRHRDRFDMENAPA
jgi:hypothetical protein